MKGKPLAGSHTQRAEPRRSLTRTITTNKLHSGPDTELSNSNTAMELHGLHPASHQHPGEEKHQMLNLNRRLETYLSRFKQLEGENALLEREIQALRRSDQGALARRTGLEKELRGARLEVDAAWRDRVCTEVEVGKLAEELHALDMLIRREAEAKTLAKTRLEQSKKELEEERRAQIWLREQVTQLEQEMRHLVQSHQHDVAQLEANLTRSRASVTPTRAQRGDQTSSLLRELEQEYSQRATGAWQEAAEAYQGQLDHLEESLDQARSRLSQVGREKSESRLKLQALEKEMASAQDATLHLEKTVDQQGHRYSQEIQQLREHLEGLEEEKEELGQQMDRLLLENRHLQQVKMSLGLEVATYRALLDNESLRGDTYRSKQPRSISITDAGFSPRGVKKNYLTQQSHDHNTSSLSSVRGTTGRGPTAITAKAISVRKPQTLTETQKKSIKAACTDERNSATCKTPYPKILQDGPVECFRPQEVHEKVTYAEPLSPPNEQETSDEPTAGHREGGEDWYGVSVQPPEEGTVAEPVVSSQVECGLSNELPFNDNVVQHQFATPALQPYHVRMTEEHRGGFSDESDEDVPAEEEDIKEPHAPIDVWAEKYCIVETAENIYEDTSGSETQAVLEPNFESRTSSQVSECEPEESMFDKDTDFRPDETIFAEDAVEIRQGVSCSVEGADETDVEDKLYPDGEEMDTWDSVIERKVDAKTDHGMEKDEEKRQHAEPEEDISAREHVKREVGQGAATGVQQDNNMATSMTDTRVDEDGRRDVTLHREPALLSDREEEEDDEEEEEEEDSQNVSVSWRTELEGDSYAQDNTLADTRPLIRYKSDETDGNTQASHVDESESSEGELEKRPGETGAGAWSDGKSKKFGTMEDLCEEGEGEALDAEYDPGYTHVDDGRNQWPNVEEMIRKVNEGYSDVETEGPGKKAWTPNVEHDEELEIDRLVEQELEDLATDSYSAHFAQQQVSESEEMHGQHESGDERKAQGYAGETKTENTSFCAEAGVGENPEPESSSSIIDQHYEKLDVRDLSAVTPQTDTDEEVQRYDHKAIDALKKRDAEDGVNIPALTHAEITEDHFGDRINRPEKINEPDESNSVSDQEKCDNVPELAESYLRDDEDRHKGIMTRHEEPVEIVPDGVPDEKDIFVSKGSEELLKTNGEDKSIDGLFSSGVRQDFWARPLETSATYQQGGAWNEAAEQTNQNLGFADNSVRGNSGSLGMYSRWDTESSKPPEARKEWAQTHSEGKQAFCRNAAEGELVHSEESEVEGESWSSGEEQV